MDFEAVLYHCTNQLFMRNKVIVECVQGSLKNWLTILELNFETLILSAISKAGRWIKVQYSHCVLWTAD